LKTVKLHNGDALAACPHVCHGHEKRDHRCLALFHVIPYQPGSLLRGTAKDSNGVDRPVLFHLACDRCYRRHVQGAPLQTARTFIWEAP